MITWKMFALFLLATEIIELALVLFIWRDSNNPGVAFDEEEIDALVRGKVIRLEFAFPTRIARVALQDIGYARLSEIVADAEAGVVEEEPQP